MPYWELERTVFENRLDAILEFWREFGVADDRIQQWRDASCELYDLRTGCPTIAPDDERMRQLKQNQKFQISAPAIFFQIGRMSLVWLRRRGLVLYCLTLLLVLTVVVPLASIAEASSVKSGNGSRFPWLGLFGLRGDPGSVMWLEEPSAEVARTVSGNANLLLLGKTGESVVLFDHQADRVIRLPPGGVVVATREP
jgi:hypothetical protein